MLVVHLLVMSVVILAAKGVVPQCDSWCEDPPGSERFTCCRNVTPPPETTPVPPTCPICPVVTNELRPARRHDEKVTYMRNDEFEEIWQDRGSGSGARDDVGIWQLKNVTSGYCSLGDVALPVYTFLCIRGISVLYDSITTKHPTGFTQIWRDSGSGAGKEFAVYRLDPPTGYTCLGDAGMGSYTDIPDKTSYCCIRSDLVVSATLKSIWWDTVTGAPTEGSIWEIIPNVDQPGIQGHNFLAVSGYVCPAGAYLLNTNDAIKVGN